MLGGKRSVIEKYYGKKFEPFRSAGSGIADLNHWIGHIYKPFFIQPGAFGKAVEAAFVQALTDGVTRLEMSMDVTLGRMLNISAEQVISTLRYYHQSVAPGIAFRPELGFSRAIPVETLRTYFDEYLDYGYFRSIDLYDDEFAQPISNFRPLYRLAHVKGLKCKAHAGEFGSAESVREAVEILELDAVQHGIGAAGSPEVMKWLAGLQIPLNVCPTSNIRLGRVRGYKSHPIRILADHGVRVTINTDDALVFGDGTSEQYRKLFKAGVFSADDLNLIRKNGLED